METPLLTNELGRAQQADGADRHKLHWRTLAKLGRQHIGEPLGSEAAGNERRAVSFGEQKTGRGSWAADSEEAFQR